MDKSVQFMIRNLLAYMAGVMIGFSAFLVAACTITGCCTTEERAAAIQAAKEIAQEVSEAVAQAKAEQEPVAGQAQAAEPETPPAAQESGQAATAQADGVDFALLSWDYGGFKGGKAAPVQSCEIGSLSIKKDGMSYKWVKGGCEQLGASSRTAADCICALFVLGADGKWRGGKFDWISTSRTSRSFENIHGEYNGWPSDAIEKAQGYAFVITSKDGKKRTNVIVSSK